MEQPPDIPQSPVPSESLRRASKPGEPPAGRITALRATVIGVIVLAVLGILILPPIQVPARLSWLGCTEVSSKSPAADGPDGLNISLAGAGSAPLRFKLSRVEQDKLPVAALKAIPAQWMPVGPMYQAQACGANKSPVVLSVPVSADATAADQLDLVSWNGKNWQWLGSHADASNAVAIARLASRAIVAQLDALPPNVMVMQTAPLVPVIGAELPADAQASDRALSDINEFAVPAFLISNDGTLQGDPAELPPPLDSSHAMFAVTRNWAPKAAANVGMVEEVLADARLRATHVKALTDVATQAQYTGVVVDYRGLTADSSEAFTRFVSELAAALHKNQKQLVVAVPAPAQQGFGPSSAEGDEWDTAGYDWRAIGALADVVQVDAPSDPAAFTTSRRVEQMLRWAVGEVSRQKLQVAFSASSIKQTGNALQLISYEEALKPFKAVTSPLASGDVFPGAQVTLALGETPGVELDEASHTYRYTLTNTDSTTSTVWINTGGALAQKLNLALRFNLRGATVTGLFASAQEPGVWVALEQYQAQAIAAVPAPLKVVWTVRNSAGTQLPGGTTTLTDTTFVWTAPADADHYTIAAALPGSATRGELAINVAQPTPTPEPTPTPTPQVIATLAPGMTDKCPDGKYIADVTVPDNSQLDKNKDFVKTWKMRNVGSCDWPAGTLAAYASGEKMGAPDSVKVGAVKIGETVDISVNMKSPDKDDKIKATWRLMDDKGNLFGEQVTVIIVAGQPLANVPAAAPPSAPSAPSAPVAAPPPAARGNLELGGHVQGFGRPDLMKKAGMQWVKIQIRHGDVPTGAINDAHSKGFKILLGTVGDKGRVMSPAYHDEFAQWCAQLAAAGADAIEVWNEPNIEREWPVGQVNGGAYTALLAKAYPAIKNANRNTLVISAALAPTGYFAGGCQDNGCNDDVFLAQMAQAGAGNYMDCVGAHHNAGATSPSATTGHPADDGNHHYSWYFWGTLNLYYNAFGGGRQVCFTEFGYLSGDGYPSLQSTAPGFAWASGVTVGQQAAWLAEAASLASNSGKVRIMIIWNVDFTYYGSDPQAGYAIIRPGGGCPACDTLGGVIGSR